MAIPDDATESVEELQKKLTTLELRGGPLNPVLVPTLGQLGAAYMGEKRYAEAIRYYRRGIHLARVNDGLNAASQVSMLEQMITALVRQENFAEADKQQAYLYRIKRWQKERGKPELLEATLRYADWMRGAYLGDLDNARYPRLVGLNDVYEDAMEEIESVDGGDSPELLPYLQGRIELSYLISVYPGEQETGFRGRATPAGQFQAADEAQLRFWRMRDHNFRYGLRALKRKEEIIRIEKGEATKESIDARIAIADWYQWHRRYAEAIRNYEEAWSVAMQDDTTGRWIDERFSDPLELPIETIFNQGAIPLGTHNEAEVVMNFDVNRHGEAKDIKILTEKTLANQASITRAYHFLRNVRFRPTVREGEVVRAKDVERNYKVRF